MTKNSVIWAAAASVASKPHRRRSVNWAMSGGACAFFPCEASAAIEPPVSLIILQFDSVHASFILAACTALFDTHTMQATSTFKSAAAPRSVVARSSRRAAPAVRCQQQLQGFPLALQEAAKGAALAAATVGLMLVREHKSAQFTICGWLPWGAAAHLLARHPARTGDGLACVAARSDLRLCCASAGHRSRTRRGRQARAQLLREALLL